MPSLSSPQHGGDVHDRSLADYADLHDAEVPVWQVLHDVAKVSQHVYRHIKTFILCTLTAGADSFTQCGPGPPTRKA